MKCGEECKCILRKDLRSGFHLRGGKDLNTGRHFCWKQELLVGGCEYAIRREGGEKSKRYGIGSSLLNILYAEGGTPLSHVTARYGGLCASLQRKLLLMRSVVSRDSVWSLDPEHCLLTDELPPVII